MPAPQSANSDALTERIRIFAALILAMFGLALAAGLVIFLVVFGWHQPTDVVAVIGLFTSVLGTLVGAFFGLQVGSAGRDKAQQAAAEANQLAQRALAALPPDQARGMFGPPTA